MQDTGNFLVGEGGISYWGLHRGKGKMPVLHLLSWWPIHHEKKGTSTDDLLLTTVVGSLLISMNGSFFSLQDLSHTNIPSCSIASVQRSFNLQKILFSAIKKKRKPTYLPTCTFSLEINQCIHILQYHLKDSQILLKSETSR